MYLLSVKMSNGSILPMDRNLSGSTSPGAISVKGYLAFPKAPALLEYYHQIV